MKLQIWACCFRHLCLSVVVHVKILESFHATSQTLVPSSFYKNLSKLFNFSNWTSVTTTLHEDLHASLLRLDYNSEYFSERQVFRTELVGKELNQTFMLIAFFKVSKKNCYPETVEALNSERLTVCVLPHNPVFFKPMDVTWRGKGVECPPPQYFAI
jgi:hypothetical protein